MDAIFQLPAEPVMRARGQDAVEGPRRRRRAASIAVVSGAGALGVGAGLYAFEGAALPAQAINVGTASAGGVLATLAAYLFLRRMRRTGALVDVFLTATLTIIAFSSVVLTVVASTDTQAVPLYAIVSVAAGIVGAVGLAASAYAPRSISEDPELSAERILGLGIIGLLITFAVVVSALLVAGGAYQETTMVAGHGIAAVVLVAAAVGFVRRAEGADQRIFMWLAMAATVTVTARATDALLPWSRVDDLSSGDIVQLAGYFALLVAGLRDFELAHRRDTVNAVVHERRRLALELHDGLAQDLAYITSETRRHGSTQHLAQAAERALEESRAAIAALTRPVDEPLDRTIHDAAHSFGARAGVEVSVAARPGLDASPEVRTALLRILRQAMANAVCHGQAGVIRVSLDGPAPLVLAVADDGCGFDPRAPRRPDAIGIQGMYERAENLGGRMTLESSPGTGTTVAVVLP